MCLIVCGLEVINKDKNHPSLNLQWFNGLVINGELVADVHIPSNQEVRVWSPEYLSSPSTRHRYWGECAPIPKEGVKVFSEIVLCFNSFESAQRAFTVNQGGAHDWEIENGVVLSMGGVITEKPIEKRVAKRIDYD